MPARRKLADDVVQRIQALFECGTDVATVAAAFDGKVSQSQLYNMRAKLLAFGSCRPTPVCKQGRPNSLNPEAQDAVVEFLIEYDK